MAFARYQVQESRKFSFRGVARHNIAVIKCEHEFVEKMGMHKMKLDVVNSTEKKKTGKA